MRKFFTLLFALIPLDVFAKSCNCGCSCGWKQLLITIGVVAIFISCFILYFFIYTKIQNGKDKKDGKFDYETVLNEKILATPLVEVIEFVDNYLVTNMSHRKGNEHIDLSQYNLGPITTQFFQKYMYLEYIDKDDGYTEFQFDAFGLENHEWGEGKVCMIEDHDDSHSNLCIVPYHDFVFCADDGYPNEKDLNSNSNIYTYLLHVILTDIFYNEYETNRQWPDAEWFYNKYFYKQDIQIKSSFS